MLLRKLSPVCSRSSISRAFVTKISQDSLSAYFKNKKAVQASQTPLDVAESVFGLELRATTDLESVLPPKTDKEVCEDVRSLCKLDFSSIHDIRRILNEESKLPSTVRLFLQSLSIAHSEMREADLNFASQVLLGMHGFGVAHTRLRAQYEIERDMIVHGRKRQVVAHVDHAVATENEGFVYFQFEDMISMESPQRQQGQVILSMLLAALRNAEECPQKDITIFHAVCHANTFTFCRAVFPAEFLADVPYGNLPTSPIPIMIHTKDPNPSRWIGLDIFQHEDRVKICDALNRLALFCHKSPLDSVG